MDSIVFDQVKEIVGALFGVEAQEISAETSPDTVKTWDSLQHLTLVLELERVFGVQMRPEEITDMTSVGAIVERIAAKKPAGARA